MESGRHRCQQLTLGHKPRQQDTPPPFDQDVDTVTKKQRLLLSGAQGNVLGFINKTPLLEAVIPFLVKSRCHMRFSHAFRVLHSQTSRTPLVR